MRSAEFRRSLWAIPVFVACGATQPQPSGANLAPAPTTVSAQEVDAAGSAGGVAQADAAAAPVPTHDAAPAAAGDRAGPFEAAKVKHAQVRALAIGSAVQIFQATQGDDFCPTYAQLIGARVLPSSSAGKSVPHRMLRLRRGRRIERTRRRARNSRRRAGALDAIAPGSRTADAVAARPRATPESCSACCAFPNAAESGTLRPWLGHWGARSRDSHSCPRPRAKARLHQRPRQRRPRRLRGAHRPRVPPQARRLL